MKDKNQQSFPSAKHILICGAVALLLMGIALPAGVGHALQGFEEGSVIPEHYPIWFDGIGQIDRIAADEVVINDKLLSLSPDIRYHTRTTENASKAWFKVGCLVGFVKDSTDRISALYLIKTSKP